MTILEPTLEERTFSNITVADDCSTTYVRETVNGVVFLTKIKVKSVSLGKEAELVITWDFARPVMREGIVVAHNILTRTINILS